MSFIIKIEEYHTASNCFLVCLQKISTPGNKVKLRYFTQCSKKLLTSQRQSSDFLLIKKLRWKIPSSSHKKLTYSTTKNRALGKGFPVRFAQYFQTTMPWKNCRRLLLMLTAWIERTNFHNLVWEIWLYNYLFIYLFIYLFFLTWSSFLSQAPFLNRDYSAKTNDYCNEKWQFFHCFYLTFLVSRHIKCLLL